jgi:secondary thiamine-phosphate synthase enzyme
MTARTSATARRSTMLVQSRSFVVSTPARQEFFDVTDRLLDFVAESGLEDGIAMTYTQHTSCCVFIQEESEDVTYYGTQLILQDTLNVFAKIAPPARNEGQYLHPGPIHIQNAAELRGEHPSWGLNTDGHIISSVLGRSATIPVVSRSAVLGEFGRVYFGDLDPVRARERTVFLTVMGR